MGERKNARARQTFRASCFIELNNNSYNLHCRVLRILCRENGKTMNNLPAFASKKVFHQVLDKQGEQTQVTKLHSSVKATGTEGKKERWN